MGLFEPLSTNLLENGSHYHSTSVQSMLASARRYSEIDHCLLLEASVAVLLDIAAIRFYGSDALRNMSKPSKVLYARIEGKGENIYLIKTDV